MKIVEISWRNFNSYGNQIQKIEFERDQGDLFLLLGGNGKCLSPNTEIQVEIEDESIKEEFVKFISKKSLPSPLDPDI